LEFWFCDYGAHSYGGFGYKSLAGLQRIIVMFSALFSAFVRLMETLRSSTISKRNRPPSIGTNTLAITLSARGVSPIMYDAHGCSFIRAGAGILAKFSGDWPERTCHLMSRHAVALALFPPTADIRR
jgi:hypothetical protein